MPRGAYISFKDALNVEMYVKEVTMGVGEAAVRQEGDI